MPAKLMKTSSGRIVEMKSINLPNGNLLVTRRNEGWVEVDPSHPDFKRWKPWSVDEPDPRNGTPEQ